MKRLLKLLNCVVFLTVFFHGRAQVPVNDPVKLPFQYFRLLEAGVQRIEDRLSSEKGVALSGMEALPGWQHFASAILIPAVLYTKSHPDNTHHGDKKMLDLAVRIGGMLLDAHGKGLYTPRQDSDWDTYMWLEAYRLLLPYLGEEISRQWQAALLDNLVLLEPRLLKCKDYPRYNAPFITTSPNHYAIYASTLLLAGHVFGKSDWIKISSEVLHRFVTEEQSADGFWGEHSHTGPTTGYDYLTETQIALYWEYSKDPDALKALRRSTDFHKYFTYPDGTPVETINDRNRYWDVSMWGHFGFSNFQDGRRYAAFLTGFFKGEGDIQSLSRLAQNALYYHEGPTEAIPQDLSEFCHAMQIPAGIRKTGPWTVCLSGLIAPRDELNNFFLDRQGNLSIFHVTRGLIITGANSKRQPDLATFTEVLDNEVVHMPLTSKLQMKDKADLLALSYHTFFAELLVPVPSSGQLEFRFKTTYKWGDARSKLNLQLVLRAGQSLVTAGGKKIMLGNEFLELGETELGGAIMHNGWRLKLPPGSALTWPVYPFNPYQDGPETDLDNAVGVLSVPLPAGDRELDFILDVER